MEPRSLQFVATACGGELQVGSPQTQVLRVCTDSRRVQPGDALDLKVAANVHWSFPAARGRAFFQDFIIIVNKASLAGKGLVPLAVSRA